MTIIKLPFIVKNGSVTTVDESSIDGKAQIAAFAIRTNAGSLPLEPTFGITDPTFEPGNIVQARAVLAQFWPEIVIDELSIGDTGADGRVDVTLRIGG